MKIRHTLIFVFLVAVLLFVFTHYNKVRENLTQTITCPSEFPYQAHSKGSVEGPLMPFCLKNQNQQNFQGAYLYKASPKTFSSGQKYVQDVCQPLSNEDTLQWINSYVVKPGGKPATMDMLTKYGFIGYQSCPKPAAATTATTSNDSELKTDLQFLCKKYF